MKLNYQLLKKLILEQLKSEFNLDMEKLRDLAYEQDLPEEEVENLMRILARYTDDQAIQDYGKELYEKAIKKHFHTEEGQHYDDSFVDYYEMNNYLGDPDLGDPDFNNFIDLGAVEIRSHLEYPDDPIIDASDEGGSGPFLGNAEFKLFPIPDEKDERRLNDYLKGEGTNYRLYTHKRIKDYLLTPEGKKSLLSYIKNKI